MPLIICCLWCLKSSIIEGAVERVRPKLMTVATTLIGLLPVMWGSETGSEVMKRIAASMVGGLISSAILTLIIIPFLQFMIFGSGGNSGKSLQDRRYKRC